MYGMELIIFFASCYLSYKFFRRWYSTSLNAWPSHRVKPIRITLMLLPFISFMIILYTLRVLASFDVVSDPVYIIFYLILGYGWIHLSLILVSLLFDISWIDDGLNLANEVSLVPISGSFLAITLIYSGANIGDGPGWWCVVIAAGLGMLAWFGIGYAINKFTGVFERITVGRDMGCGIRIGGYLLGSGIILARASAGDWTSFQMTLIEFLAGWPVLLLALLTYAVEIYHINNFPERYPGKENNITGSVFMGAFYTVISILFVMLSPLK